MSLNRIPFREKNNKKKTRRSNYREIDGIAYEALVKEKQKAQTEYDQAISQGQAAAQVSSARDANQFTVSVNIEPRAKVTFNLTYEELLVRRHGIYEHLIHVNPGQVVENLSIDVDIAEVLPLQRVRVPALRDDIKNNEVHEMGKSHILLLPPWVNEL